MGRPEKDDGFYARLIFKLIYYNLRCIHPNLGQIIDLNLTWSSMLSKDDNWIEDSDVLSIFPTYVWSIQSTSEFHDRVQTRVLNVLNRINSDLADIPAGES